MKTRTQAENLSPLLSIPTIQLKADNSITILNVQYRVEDLTEAKAQIKNSEEEILQQIRATRNNYKKDSIALSILFYEEDALNANKQAGGSSTGLKAIDLKQSLDLIRQRITELKTKQSGLIETMNQKIGHIRNLKNKLEKLGYNGIPMGEVLVKLGVSRAGNQKFGLSYYVGSAGWIPTYDFRVSDVSHPLTLNRKATVLQATHEDWKNVKLTLSNSNPMQLGELPVLKPYFVDRGYPIVNTKPIQSGYVGLVEGTILDAGTRESIGFSGITFSVNGEKKGGTLSDLDGKFKLIINEKGGQIEITSVGYQKKTITHIQRFQEVLMQPNISVESKSISHIPTRNINQMLITNRFTFNSGDEMSPNIKGMRSTENSVFINGIRSIPTTLIGASPASYSLPEVSQKENPTSVSFEIKEPYTILANGKENMVDISSQEIDVQYQYVTIPKIDPFVYLTAALPDWENLNLLEGNAAVYYENTYIGTTKLQLPGTDDTLKLNLGTDKQIVVQRNKLTGTLRKQTLGSNRIATREFEIRVRNNKSIPVNVTLIDQFPIVYSTAYSVEKLEQSDAELDPKTGLLTWRLALTPSREGKLKLSYKVKYPARAQIYLE